MEEHERKNRIEEALKIRNMRQIELAEKSGVSKASINHWIKQRYQPKQTPLYKMAAVLDVSEMWLAGYDVPMDRTPAQKKADELARLIHQLRSNERIKNISLSLVKLNPDQLSIIENMVNELLKLNPEK